jgi:hypothetical protein
MKSIKIWHWVFILAQTFLFGKLLAWNSESFDGWVLGTNEPEISSVRTLADGSTGPSIHVFVGASPFYYEVSDVGGEGSITFFIYDPGKCIETVDAGYGARGPMWGLQNTNHNTICVGITRVDYLSNCRGYGSCCNITAPYSSFWYFKDGLRNEYGTDWSLGWYKWTIDGSMDDITFTLHDVDYDSIDGSGYALVHGNAIRTYDASSCDGLWASVFGIGWNAFHINPDDPSGVEDISVDIISGTGIFYDAGSDFQVSRTYKSSNWGTIKNLFR